MDKKIDLNKYFKSMLLKKLGALLTFVGVVLLFLSHWYVALPLIIIGIILMMFLKCPYCNTRVTGGIFSKPLYCNNCCHQLPKRKDSDNKEEER
ncbi:hypothetical protein [Oceanirhabdus sp. W0125-5]|uniref:hypothetical protein n=1 Tax=Oceanirhabdus sp. W0125-5 TaxID=2999116 RepID=UPI0022F2A746|nr:hypothetical protein [Oceanirhabdus sp. W0125-5]WBW94758.1 hypothetical protein OW730_13740 [Oceanirhabdus sp. W0125-5]